LRRGQFVHGVLLCIRGHQSARRYSAPEDGVRGALTLFQVIAEHQGLPRGEQRAFWLHQQETQASPFNHLRLIHDVILQLS
ncbi:hypothetical protein ACR80S_12150, partial [Halomonas sp. MA07-2]